MFKEAYEILEKSQKIYVVAHVNPDGDAIGSTFGIALALRKIGKDAKVVMPECSDTFKFLPHFNEHVDKIEDKEYDLLIALDSSDSSRLAISQDEFNRAKNVIMLDHHQKSKPFGNYRYIDDKKSSASEIAFLFIKHLGVKIDEDIATYLYTGIMTDTGSFNYSNTSSKTHRVIAKLIECGAKHVEVCKKINDTMKEGKLRLLAKTVDNMETYYGGMLRLSYVSYNEIKELGLGDEDSEGMSNYLRKIENTEVAVYIRGKSDGTEKVSMRSNGRVDVSKIAIKFQGGGHPRAAGYTMNETYDIEKEKLIKAIGEMLK